MTEKTNPPRKTFVLDTSVLLSSPNAIHQFVEHEVVLPLVVIKELEGKRNDAILGFPAREALRAIDAIAEKGDINAGVEINDQGGTVRVEINHVDQSGLPDAMATDRTHDTRILAVAKNLSKDGRDVTVVSKDMPMRLLAKTLGLGADQFRGEMVVVNKPYTGVIEHQVDDEVIDALYEQGDLDIVMTDLDTCDVDHDDEPEDENPLETAHPNTGVILVGSNKKSAIARVTADKRLTLVGKTEPFGVSGRSAEQKIALAHLMDPSIGAVSLGGLAGSGKTYLALAAGLEQVMEARNYTDRSYKKVFVFRPLYAVGGQDLGYLPGSADEKMGPWGAAVFDALGSMVGKEVVEEITRRDMLEVLPLTHLRGRTLNDAYVIVDEAQNLEKPVLMTALTRLGENSKIVLSWDAAQRDNTRVGRHDGIAAIVERLKGEPLFAHTTFSKSERGPVAAMATRLLDDMV
jgi:PhoH-like ATPase